MYSKEKWCGTAEKGPLFGRFDGLQIRPNPMIHEFVEKILVHAPEKIDGERSVQVDIYLRFIGNFPVPIPEPTPEELARQEAERKRRAANRQKYYQRKEKLRQAEQSSQEKNAI